MNLIKLWGGNRRKSRPELSRLRLKISVIVEPDDDGFHAYCPALSGLHVGGNTRDDVLKGVKEAIDVYLKSIIRHDDPLPIGQHFSISETRNYQVQPAAAETIDLLCPIPS